MDKLRCIVRPILSLAFSTTILILAIMYGIKYGSPDLAKDIIVFVLATGSTIVGFWFGQRKAGG